MSKQFPPGALTIDNSNMCSIVLPFPTLSWVSFSEKSMKVFLAVLLVIATNVWSGPSIPAPRPIIVPRPMPVMPRVTPSPTPSRMTPAPSAARTFGHQGQSYTSVYQNNVLMWVIWFNLVNGQQVEQRADCINPKDANERNLCETAKTQK